MSLSNLELCNRLSRRITLSTLSRVECASHVEYSHFLPLIILVLGGVILSAHNARVEYAFGVWSVRFAHVET